MVQLTQIGNIFNKQLLIVKIVFIILIVGAGWYGYRYFFAASSSKVVTTTAVVKRGTIISTVASSGQITSANNSSISTTASGVVKSITATNGQHVVSGDPIFELELDQPSKLRYTQALASYQSAKNAYESASANAYTLQSDMFTRWKSFYELSTNGTYQNSDGSPNYANRALAQFHIAEDDWLASEAKYKNQQAVISQTQTALNSAWLSLLASSPIVRAPISGEVNGLSLQVGSVLAQTDANSSGAATSQKIANIITQARPIASINLSEIDVSSVKIGDTARLTLDAFSKRPFRGQVMSINTVGSVTSGVTSYPVAIVLDTDNAQILPNMSVNAVITTAKKDNVLVVPSSAIKTLNRRRLVTVKKDGKEVSVPVRIGVSSDTETEVISGLSEGDVVVTGSVATSSTTTSTATTSPFSPAGGFRVGGAGRAR